MSDFSPDDLAPGDTLELPDGDEIVIVGVAPAEETPMSAREGPLYEAKLNGQRFLYRPHNIRLALQGGAEYAGQQDVDETRPFWCDGCDHPKRSTERSPAPLLDDVDVCCYGCKERVHSRIMADRLEDDY